MSTPGWQRFAALLVCAAMTHAGNAFAQGSTLSYVGWSQDEAASKPTLTAMFDSFQKASPGVKLDVIGYPWAQMQQNLVLRLRSNQPMHVAQMQERWLPTFAALDNLVDLNDVYGRANLEKQIDPGLLKLGQIGGKQIGLPWTAGSIGMVANLKVLKDAGIATPPATVDEFLAALRAIKKAQPQAVPYALMTKNNSSMSPEFQVWLWTFGGQLFDDRGNVKVASPAAVKALTFMTDLVRENLAAKDGCSRNSRPRSTTMRRWPAGSRATTPDRAPHTMSTWHRCRRRWSRPVTPHSRWHGGTSWSCSSRRAAP
jgi:multiple sugar transport system substrate-binding protein